MNRLVLALFLAYNGVILYFSILFLARIHKLYNEGREITINLFIATALGILLIGGIVVLLRRRRM